MKKIITLLICLFSFTCNLAYSESAIDTRLYELENKVMELTGRMYLMQNQLNALLASGYTQMDPKTQIKIDSIGDYYFHSHRLLKLSNGTTYFYNVDEDIAHWLVGQTVKLQKGKKTDYITIFNVETADEIQGKKVAQ